MADHPARQPEKSGNGFWIAVACLAVGYFAGQSTGNSTQAEAAVERAEPTPQSLVQLTNATSNTASSDPSAEDLNELAMAAAADAANAADAVDASDADSARTGDTEQTAYAAEATTYADQSSQPEQDPGGATTSETGSSEYAQDQSDTYVPSFSVPVASAPPAYSYSTPPIGYSGPSSKCSGVGCYGEISSSTGLPRTTYVHGYFRSNGTYVQPYYRSRRR